MQHTLQQNRRPRSKPLPRKGKGKSTAKVQTNSIDVNGDITIGGQTTQVIGAAKRRRQHTAPLHA